MLFGRKIKTKQVNKGVRRMEHIFELEGFTQEMDGCFATCNYRCANDCVGACLGVCTSAASK